MTGEDINERTTNRYKNDIFNGSVPLVIGIQGHKYFVNPNFIAKWNNFEKDTTLISGGFCYSYLGGWPGVMKSSGAGGYFGFDWSVYTDCNADWAKALFRDLTDTTNNLPMTVQNWMINTPEIPKYYYKYEGEKVRKVQIKYDGYKDLALFERKTRDWKWPLLILSISPIGAQVERHITWDPSIGYDESYDTLLINLGFFTQNYETKRDSNIITGSIDKIRDLGAHIEHEIGNFTLVIDENNLDILSFSIDHKERYITNNGTDTTTTFWEIEGNDIPFDWKSDFTLRQYEDNNAMSHITKFEYQSNRVSVDYNKSEERLLKLENNNATTIEFYWSSTP